MADLDWLNSLQKSTARDPLDFLIKQEPKVKENKPVEPIPFGESLLTLNKNLKMEATVTIDDIRDTPGWHDSPLPSEHDNQNIHQESNEQVYHQDLPSPVSDEFKEAKSVLSIDSFADLFDTIRDSLTAAADQRLPGQKQGVVPARFKKWTAEFKRLMLDEMAKCGTTDDNQIGLTVKYFTQTIAMFLFSTLDFVDPARKIQSLVVEQPLKTSACARHFVEQSYDLLSGLAGVVSEA